MRLVIVSDTHNKLPSDHTLPDGDVLIHCGDGTMGGRLGEVCQFSWWLKAQPHPHKLFVPGNHDFAFEKWRPGFDEAMSHMTDAGVRVLIDEAVTIDGAKFYGTPWMPEFGNWAFMVPAKRRREAAARIPDDTKILITHGPPAGVLDRSEEGESCGCEVLAERLRAIGPALHCFGHIHEGYGVRDGHWTRFVNASTCNRQYRPVNPPQVVDLP